MDSSAELIVERSNCLPSGGDGDDCLPSGENPLLSRENRLLPYDCLFSSKGEVISDTTSPPSVIRLLVCDSMNGRDSLSPLLVMVYVTLVYSALLIDLEMSEDQESVIGMSALYYISNISCYRVILLFISCAVKQL